MHVRKTKCKVNKITIVCFFSKTYCKSLSLPLMSEILCAKPSNLIYISRMHAILLQGLYRMPCELNHFIVKSWHSCGRITLLARLHERTDTHQKALLLLSLRSTPGDFGERQRVQLSTSSKRKSCSGLGSVIDRIAFPLKPMGVFLSLVVRARLGPQ